jgi:hypothetical protein
MDKDPSDLSVDLRIVHLGIEGAVGTTRPRIHPHCHLPSPEWLDVVADKGPQEVHAHQLTSLQLLDDVVHVL